MRGVENDETEGEFEMRRTVLVALFLCLVLVPTLIGMGVDIGARLGVQSPSLAIQAEWDIATDFTMGLLVETSLDLLFDPAAAQTPSIRIGLQAKYRFTHIHPAFVPYFGAVGSLGLLGADTTIAVDARAGARIYITRDVHLFAEVAFLLFPFPDVATWADLAGFYKGLYVGFGVRL